MIWGPYLLFAFGHGSQGYVEPWGTMYLGLWEWLRERVPKGG